MDKRTTLAINETFLEMLINCQNNNATVAMLIDDKGLVRAEGFIHQIMPDAESPYLELAGGMKVVLKTITASMEFLTLLMLNVKGLQIS